MPGTNYRYLQIDSQNRLSHETNSKITVSFGGLPIKNINLLGGGGGGTAVAFGGGGPRLQMPKRESNIA
jgi:hypothetical protein